MSKMKTRKMSKNIDDVAQKAFAKFNAVFLFSPTKIAKIKMPQKNREIKYARN